MAASCEPSADEKLAACVCCASRASTCCTTHSRLVCTCYAHWTECKQTTSKTRQYCITGVPESLVAGEPVLHLAEQTVSCHTPSTTTPLDVPAKTYTCMSISGVMYRHERKDCIQAYQSLLSTVNLSFFVLLYCLCEQLGYRIGCSHEATVQVSLDFQRSFSLSFLGHNLCRAAESKGHLSTSCARCTSQNSMYSL